MFIVIFALALIIVSSPSPCALPIPGGCSLAHGFVIGNAPYFPGTIEIWNCAGKTIVTLNQVRDLPEGTGPVTRNHFCPELRPGERLMGCRGEDENFDGTVAITSASGGGRPDLREAWLADTGQWKFVPAMRTDLICNRGLTAN
ncbi:MAG: hypothetical protein OEL20_14740 [Sulfuritalea sp.]|nr:hypothetical protein [Sulfuritalea sp.]